MGSMIASAAGSAICTACCSVCGKLTPDDDKFGKVSRIPYLFLTILSGIFAVFMSIYGEKHFKLSFVYSGSLCSTNDACDGDGSVYRVCFSLFIFEAIHVLMVPFLNDFHWFMFPIKFVFFIGLVCFTFFYDESTTFYNDFALYVSRFASIFYLIIQILILIDWAWNVKEWFEYKVTKYINYLNMDFEEYYNNYKCWKNPFMVLNVLMTLVLYFGSFAVVCVFFSNKLYGGCALNQGFILITLILIVFNFLFSAMAGGGTFTVASLMSFYAMFLLYNALSSEDDEECNPFYKSDEGSMWLGILFTLISLCYSAMKADLLGSAVDMSGVSCFGCCPGYVNDANDSKYNIKLHLRDADEDNNRKESLILDSMSNYDDNNNGNNNNAVGDDAGTVINVANAKDDNNGGNDKNENLKDNNDNSVNSGDSDEDEKPKISKKQKKRSTIYFHLVLMLASCYMAMLFTDWGVYQHGIDTKGMVSVWANMGTQWLSMLLFWQTLAVFRRESKNNDE